jgi:hypothetical protein
MIKKLRQAWCAYLTERLMPTALMLREAAINRLRKWRGR